jgi:hypothetical protein
MRAGRRVWRAGAGGRVRDVAAAAAALLLRPQESFEHVEEWMSEVDRYANENTSKLLVGNKADLVERKQISTEAAQVLAPCVCQQLRSRAATARSSEQKFADKLGVSFLETSAKTATNVEAAFLTMAKELIRTKWALSRCRLSAASLGLAAAGLANLCCREKQAGSSGGGVGEARPMKLSGAKQGGKKKCCQQ